MKCFRYALAGLRRAVREQRNLRIHLCAAFYVVCAGLITGASAPEWTALLLCIALVISLELLNTAVENACDALHPDYSEKIGAAKDAAAGAVLVSAVLSAACGLLIFLQADKLEQAGRFAAAHPLPAALLALTLLPAVLFIIGRKKK